MVRVVEVHVVEMVDRGGLAESGLWAQPSHDMISGCRDGSGRRVEAMDLICFSAACCPRQVGSERMKKTPGITITDAAATAAAATLPRSLRRYSGRCSCLVPMRVTCGRGGMQKGSPASLSSVDDLRPE